ncbi:hypothetical protein [Azospirillum griseum]|uniref:DUF3102 domain-containing protein n=1 Tax=Azospirillum griseum TaxID=2496639 RepID=A0A3S0K6V0_9PROT|nr:hypothetical protein [Azospirillum griseum]RTR11812.1 hypothetical protein EJ903_25870 [Azospirillum griseum]
MARKRQLEGIDADELKRMLEPAAATLPSARPTTPPVEVLPSAPPKPMTVDEFFDALSIEIAASKKHYMRIGALLDRADDMLGGEGRAALVRRLSATHNVGAAALSQMMTAYRAISNNKVPPELESTGYTTVYLLADLSEQEAEQARAEGLLQPGVRQAAVKEFIKRQRRPTLRMTERETLEAEIADLEARLEKARSKLATLVD